MMPSCALKGAGYVRSVPVLASSPAAGRSITGRSIHCCSSSRAAFEHYKDASIAEPPHIEFPSSQQQHVQAFKTQSQQQSDLALHSSGAQATTPRSSSSSSSNSRGPSTARRQLLLRSTLAPFLVPLVLGSDDATTIVNSVLSAYGLPTLKAAAGFRFYDEFEDEFYFEYPKSWVSRPNSMRKGVYISDFQTADKVSVEELDLPEDGDIATAAVAAAVLPGGRRLVQDDVLSLPARRLIKTRTELIDGQEMLYLEFPSETITRSGYNIRRKNFAAAAVKRDKLYTIAASARSDQFNEEKKQLLQHIIESFRIK